MITATRYQLEAEYRKYFTEIRKFDPFPATVSYQNMIDFLEWHDRQNISSVRETPEATAARREKLAGERGQTEGCPK